jgi:hypothetical protein
MWVETVASNLSTRSGLGGSSTSKGDPGTQGAPGPMGPTGAQGPRDPAGVGEYAASFARYSSPTIGGVGGREGMHALCDSQFPGSHMCHLSEYMNRPGFSGDSVT